MEIKRKVWVFYDTEFEHGMKGFEMVEQAEAFITDVMRRNGNASLENFGVVFGDLMILEPKEIIIKSISIKYPKESV